MNYDYVGFVLCLAVKCFENLLCHDLHFLVLDSAALGTLGVHFVQLIKNISNLIITHSFNLVIGMYDHKLDIFYMINKIKIKLIEYKSWR